MPPPSEEVIHPLPAIASESLVREVKTTLLVSSLKTLRDLGHFEGYLAHLPAKYRDSILLAVAGTWLPIEAGIAHYRAIDALELPTAEQSKIGAAVGERLHGPLLSTLVTLARNTGVTPWTALAHTQRLFERLFRGGGGTRVVKLGPKDARIEIVGFPLAAIPYLRTTTGAIIEVGGVLFASRGYVNEIPKLCTPTSLAYRVAWA